MDPDERAARDDINAAVAWFREQLVFQQNSPGPIRHDVAAERDRPLMADVCRALGNAFTKLMVDGIDLMLIKAWQENSSPDTGIMIDGKKACTVVVDLSSRRISTTIWHRALADR